MYKVMFAQSTAKQSLPSAEMAMELTQDLGISKTLGTSSFETKKVQFTFIVFIVKSCFMANRRVSFSWSWNLNFNSQHDLNQFV